MQVALEYPTLYCEEFDKKLRKRGVPFGCCYVYGYTFDAADLPTVWELIEGDILTICVPDLVYGIDLIVEELAGVRDFSDNGIYADAMFEMLHHADCFRESVADLYATDYLDSDYLEPVHNMRNGFPDLGI